MHRDFFGIMTRDLLVICPTIERELLEAKSRPVALPFFIAVRRESLVVAHYLQRNKVVNAKYVERCLMISSLKVGPDVEKCM